MAKDMDIMHNRKSSDALSLPNLCLTSANDYLQNNIENRVHDNDIDYDNYMAKFDCDAHLNMDAMDNFELYDIAFAKLTSQDQFKKIKEHMLTNPSLIFSIYNDFELKEKYHASFKKELDKLLEDPYARQYCIQKFEK